MSKKLIALVLAFAMVFSTFSVAFADTAIGADAAAAEALGMLKGEGYGVNAAYLAKSSTRIQAAIMFLRLKGLEQEALQFTGTANFADAAGVKSEGNKAVMAYLKSRPELGWTGVGSNMFAPAREIASAEFYKVMLEALGYQQGVDFQWSEVKTFAASKGLSKAANVVSFTNNDIAIATIEALLQNAKGTDKTLAAQLVEAGIISEAVAVSTGVYVKPVAMVVKEVKAVANTMVEVTVENALTVAPQANAFVIKDAAGVALEVKNVALSADGKTIIVTTAAQVVGGKYTVTFNNTNYTVVGQLIDTVKPEVSSIVSMANNKVKVTFVADKFNKATLLNAANYVVDKNLSVLGVAMNVDVNGDEIANEVILTTGTQTVGTLYSITVNNIADLSGNVITEVSKKFSGQAADTTKPELKAAYTKDGVQIIVQFTENSLLTAASLLDLANYSVEGLTLTGVEVVKNSLTDSVKEVKITTSAQTIGKLYTLKVKGIADEYSNVIVDKSISISGSAVDTVAQEVVSAVATTNTKVKVTFLDETDAAALVAGNYTIEGLTVTGAAYEVVAGVAVKTSVILTTSAQTTGKIYKVVVANVKDEAGNAIKTGKDYVSFAGRVADTTVPTISGTVASNNTTLTVTFSEVLDKATATNAANYYVEGLGYAIEATHSNGVVTLTTPKQASGKIYTMVVNGVTDVAGNVVKADTKVTFAGIGEVTGDLKLEGVVSMNNQTIKLLFNGEVALPTDLTGFEIKKDSAAITNDVASAGTTFAALAGTVSYDGTDKTVLVIRTTNVFDTAVYTVKAPNTIATIFDATKTLATDTNQVYKTMEFAGMNNTLGTVTVQAIVPIDGTHYKVIFSEPVMGTATNVTLYYTDANGIAQTATPALTATTAAKEVFVTLGAALPEYKVVEFAMNPAGLTDQFGTARVGTYVRSNPTTTQYELDFASGSAAVEALQLAAVVGIDKNTVDLIFNKDVTYTGSVQVGAAIAVAANDIVVTGKDFVVKNIVSTTDANRLRVYFTTTDMVEGTAYELEINNVVKFVDEDSVAITNDTNNYNVATFGYVGADNPVIKIAGVAPVNGNTIRVTLSEKAVKTTAVSAADILLATDFVVKDADGNTLAVSEAAGATFASTATVIYLQLNTGDFLAGNSYTVALADTFAFADETLTVTNAHADVKTGSETGAAIEFAGIKLQ